MTPDLFTFARGEALAAKESGIALADHNADAGWKARAYDAVITIARLRLAFTSDDVIEWMTAHGGFDADVNPAALGPVFRRAAANCEIKKTGRMIPTRMRQRHRDLTEWERA